VQALWQRIVPEYGGAGVTSACDTAGGAQLTFKVQREVEDVNVVDGIHLRRKVSSLMAMRQAVHGILKLRGSVSVHIRF